MIFYPTSRGFSLARLFTLTKSFAWLVGTDKPHANNFVNAKSHSRERPLLAG